MRVPARNGVRTGPRPDVGWGPVVPGGRPVLLHRASEREVVEPAHPDGLVCIPNDKRLIGRHLRGDL